MKPCRLLRVMMVLLTAVCIADPAGARMYRSFSQEAPFYTPPPPDRYDGMIVVKFHNGSEVQGVPDRARLFRSAAVNKSADLERLCASLVKAGAAAPAPTFTRPVNELRAERAAAERNVGEELPDLTLFFNIPVPDYRAAVALLEALRTNALVETAYARTLPVAPPTPDLSTNQIYLGSAATNGYDVQFAWSKPGGSGSQARLIDIEYDWTFDHEDLQMSSTNLLWGDLYTAYGADHGTASVGISGALSNGFGMSGIIHNGSIRMISPISGGNYVLANAINQAVSFTAPGDVILLEQQDWSTTFTNYCPVEVEADVYSAIANATALGRIVIEPAGNGSLDLDDAGWGGIFQRSTRDSGAIMIGAGTCTDRSRCDFSCYGSRLDIQGWGDSSVATLGYTNLYGSAATNCYTGTFAGTSSASALSAAIAAAIQSYARVNYGFYLPPLLMRSNLVQSGYAQTFGLSGNIGPLPNLSNAFLNVDILAMVTPWDDLSAQGCYGGPFSPSNKVYLLTNAGPSIVTWTVTHTQSWVNVAPTGVTLAAFVSTQVVVSVNAAAGALSPGQYTDAIVFSNVTSGVTQTRAMALTVTKADQTITFSTIPDQVATGTVGLSATASSGLAVSFNVGSGSAQLTSGTNLSFTGTGLVSIVASQAGDGNWNAAPSVTNSLTVTASALSAPQNVAASDGRYMDKVAVTWSAVSGVTGYQVWRGINSEQFPPKADPPLAEAVSGERLAPQKAGSAVSSGRSQIGETTGTNFSDTSATPGQTYYYWIKATNASATSAFSSSDSGWRRSVGCTHYADVDLDGDRKMDLVLFDPVTGTWSAKLSASGYAIATALLGGPACTPVPGDYDGDIKIDPGIYEEPTGLWTVMLSSMSYGVVIATLGGMGYAPVPGDFDGDRKTDLGVYLSATGAWTVKLSASSYAEADTTFGGPDYLPVQRDYDGDGKADPAIYNLTTGNWYVMLSGSGYGIASAPGFGGPTYTPVPGDYDGDHLSDPAIYSESTGTWYVMLSGSGYLIASATLGGSGYAALPGDYDGDGKTDPAVYNTTTGDWFVMLSASGYGIAAANFGGEGYDPVGFGPDQGGWQWEGQTTVP